MRPGPDRRHTLQRSYDTVAGEYAANLYDELGGKPLDRELLDRFAAEVRGRGTACDLGCGPAQIARYLKDRGADVVGLDLSHEMLREAARRNPDVAFVQGDMLRLPVRDASLAGIAAFYAIVHVAGDALAAALAEIRRVLAPGAPLLVAFHVGDEVVHRDEMWDRPVDLDFVFHQPDAVASALAACGLACEETILRDPYEGVEHPSRRAYLWARRR
jgi:ubiquinone/menaquinone biosynthesis C-methylase UbiE